MSTTDRSSSRIAQLEYQIKALQTRVRQLEGATQTGGVRRGRWKAKLDEDLDQGSSATASLWHHDGSSLVDIGVNVEVYDWFLKSGETVSTGLKVTVEKMQDGKWWVTAAECED